MRPGAKVSKRGEVVSMNRTYDMGTPVFLKLRDCQRSWAEDQRH